MNYDADNASAPFVQQGSTLFRKLNLIIPLKQTVHALNLNLLTKRVHGSASLTIEEQSLG